MKGILTYRRLGREAKQAEQEKRYGDAADKYGERVEICLSWMIAILACIIILQILKLVLFILH